MTQYPTDLTEKQWQVIKNILEPQARNRKHPLKDTAFSFKRGVYSWPIWGKSLNLRTAMQKHRFRCFFLSFI